jgi:hypothetical protein
VSQRAKVAKETEEVLRMYEKCGEDSDAVVDRILAESTVFTKSIAKTDRENSHYIHYRS